jgi:hypothetical protein
MPRSIQRGRPAVNRREFLRGAGGLIVVGGFTPQIVEWFERLFYRRRFWPVGVDLEPEHGLVPVEGCPGVFMDRENGQLLNIRAFRESHKWDTVIIPAREHVPGEEVLFFQPPSGEFQPATDEEVVQHMRELRELLPDEEVTQYLHGLLQHPPVFEVPARTQEAIDSEPFYRQKISDILKKA